MWTWEKKLVWVSRAAADKPCRSQRYSSNSETFKNDCLPKLSSQKETDLKTECCTYHQLFNNFLTFSPLLGHTWKILLYIQFQESDFDEPCRSLPTQGILWFCEICCAGKTAACTKQGEVLGSLLCLHQHKVGHEDNSTASAQCYTSLSILSPALAKTSK